MTLVKRYSNQCTLGVDVAGSTSFAVLGNITKAINGGSGGKAEMINLSLLNDVVDTFTRGSVNPGQIKFSIAYDPADTNTTTILSSLNAAYATLATAIPNWQITYAATGAGASKTSTRLGVVVEFEVKAEKNNMVEADVTVQMSGTETIA